MKRNDYTNSRRTKRDRQWLAVPKRERIDRIHKYRAWINRALRYFYFNRGYRGKQLERVYRLAYHYNYRFYRTGKNEYHKFLRLCEKE